MFAVYMANIVPGFIPASTVKHLAILLIVFYQKFISPFKGFRCAHAVLHGGDSCSEAVKKIVREKGPIGGSADIRARFCACKEAHETLIGNGQRRRDRCDCSDCSCDCSDLCGSKKSDACDGIGCDLSDLSCDARCDCSF
ncbi:MAG: membrane protein insertion efficiency factor YidD [Gammaproteobacteria bacterium]